MDIRARNLQVYPLPLRKKCVTVHFDFVAKCTAATLRDMTWEIEVWTLYTSNRRLLLLQRPCRERNKLTAVNESAEDRGFAEHLESELSSKRTPDQK